VVERILDCAGQKGTGKWTVGCALDHGVPLSLISESVFARCLSVLKKERLKGNTLLSGPHPEFRKDKESFIDALSRALYCAKIISYTQGFSLMKNVSGKYGWGLDYGAVARIWRGGCIIRSSFLDKIDSAYKKEPELENLLFAPSFTEIINTAQADLRHIVATAAAGGIPVPCFSAALNYYDGLRSARLPANLLQAQRDYFGAHTYELTDKKQGEFFHTDWTGRGGATTSTSYNR
jgi:6-phosphogluconate dehydrogenase